MKNIKNKKLLITGGTGSFGQAVVKKFLNTDHFDELRIFSRDEKKQDDMRRRFKSQKIKFYIGDIRDLDSVDNVCSGIDYVFHAAALKQVPSCEFFPVEAVKTNILGTNNLIKSAEKNKVKKVICLSTDKAAYPINAMGMSKALMEKVAIANSRNLKNTIVCITRYGNVMCSRGSVIPLFIEQILSNKSITITDPKMTRFLMSLESAVDLVEYAFENGNQGDLFVKKAPACNLEVLSDAVLEIFGKDNSHKKIIGIRHGEKLFESLCTREEMLKSEDLGEFYRIPADNRDLNYGLFLNQGRKDKTNLEDYNSNNTTQLDKNSVIKLLSNLSFVKKNSNK